MAKEIEIPEGCEARIEGNKVILEQKESEDERIRKNLIELLLDTPAQDIISHNLELSKVLAYLEKQKEQKPAVEQLDGTFNSYDMAKTFVEGQYYVMEHPERFGLCKPVEWSEEDKHCIHQLILFCENCMQQDSEAIRCATWLKSLRPQSHWKPSEEQMEAIENVIKCELSAGLHTRANILQTLQNELKKL